MTIIMIVLAYALLIYVQGQKLLRQRKLRDLIIVIILYLVSMIPLTMLELGMDVPPVNTAVRVLVKRLTMR